MTPCVLCPLGSCQAPSGVHTQHETSQTAGAVEQSMAMQRLQSPVCHSPPVTLPIQATLSWRRHAFLRLNIWPHAYYLAALQMPLPHSWRAL